MQKLKMQVYSTPISVTLPVASGYFWSPDFMYYLSTVFREYVCTGRNTIA
jgi:hypothetical protein